MYFSSLRGSWRLGHVSAGISRPAKSRPSRNPWTNHHQGPKEPCLCSCLGSRPLDLPQQGGLPAGYRHLLCPPECCLGQIYRKTLVFSHHSIQDLQVHTYLSVCPSECLSPVTVLTKDISSLVHSLFFIPLHASLFVGPDPCLQPLRWFIKGSVQLVGKTVLIYSRCSVQQPGSAASLGKPRQQSVWWLWCCQSWVGISQPAAGHLSGLCKYELTCPPHVYV